MIRNCYKLSNRSFSVLSSSMLRPSCVDISERIAEFTLPPDENFVRLKDQKRALQLVTNSHLGLVPKSISSLVLNKNGKTFSAQQINKLKEELNRIDKEEKEYIREPAPNINMLNPESWYPKSRAKKRKIIYHYGPTNSGKTYQALEALKKAKTGVYCAPLRLLAWEIYEKLQESGVPTRLITGEEVFGSDNFTHTSSTVEMADIYQTEYDIAVIDEIQLISDAGQDRGWAWTRALLGIQANEIHICGDETVKNLIINITQECGDVLEFKKYRRLCPLRMDNPITNYNDIESGDCIVGFNRADLYKIKNEIERNTQYKCALIYGRLPPENRRTQAKLFNNKNNGYDVLIASDAIGMGLNLNIRRIIFQTINKWNGYRKTKLTNTEILQIAGRAGRYKMYDEGYVSCLNISDYKYIYKNLQHRPPAQYRACIKPEEEAIFSISQQYPWLRFSDIIRCFAERCEINLQKYFIPNYEGMLKIAEMLHYIPLSVKDKYIFTTIPLRYNSIEALGFIQEWAVNLANDKLVHLEIDQKQLCDAMNKVQNNIMNDYNNLNQSNDINNINMNVNDINDVELLYSVLSCYRFLSFRFPTFVDHEKCEYLTKIAANMIQHGFDDVTIQNKYHYQKQQNL